MEDFLRIIRRLIQNPVKHLRWSFHISYSENFILGVSQDCEYGSTKTKSWCVVIYFRKNYDCHLCKLISKFNLSSHYYLVVRNCHKFITRVFYFKLVNPCSWINMILITHYLPVQTHHNNYRLSFSNFFGESKETVLF